MTTHSFSKPEEQVNIALEMKKNHAVLLTMFVATVDNQKNWFIVYLTQQNGLHCVQSLLDINEPTLFDLSPIFPVCNRLQRMIAELFLIPTQNSKDKRAWLTHQKPYAFEFVSGEGVHEIAVGPVHAGIIEPGHFRFSVIGEEIVKLETRLGYTHKAIHSILKNISVDEARKIVGRISGDSTVAYAAAFAMACENAIGFQLSEKIKIERAILLERERIANHIGDIGAIINDTGIPSIHAFFQCAKEKVLRANQHYYHHRYAMDCVKPFEKNSLAISENYTLMLAELHELQNELQELKTLVDSHHGLEDRLQTTGIITTEQASSLCLLGLSAKASGIDHDVRRLLPDTLYQNLMPSDIKSGDVFARVFIRFKEIFDSIAFIQSWILLLSNASQNSLVLQPKKIGIGCVEGWRGPVTMIVSIQNDVIEWCHCHDPSWQNWLALEYAVIGNIVADFPLINKSFNLSYSGHDS